MTTRTSKVRRFVFLAVGLGVFIGCRSDVAASQASHPSKESYFPLSVGNSWVYSFRGDSGLATKTVEWKITQRELVRGSAVFHLWQTPPQGDEPLSLSELETGIAEAGTERFVLKNGLHTGDRWSVKSRSLRAPGKLDAFEALSVGKVCFDGRRSFEDCAIVREIDEANDVASLTTYARGVGPVKYVYFKGAHSDVVNATLTIKSWEVH